MKDIARKLKMMKKMKGDYNKMKKFGAILLAIMMIAMVGLAYAQETTGVDANKKTNGSPETVSSAGVVERTTSDGTKITGATPQDNTLRIYKEIVVFNASSENTVVYLPNMTYDYTIAGADVTDNSKYITDEFDSKILIQDGESTPLSTTTASVTYSATAGISNDSGSISTTPYVVTSTTGTVAQGYFDITFDPTKYSHAGVYRYVITETPADDLDDAGIYHSDYTTTRYLDVYVMNSNDTYAIYGYVLFDGTADTEFDADNGDLTVETSGKTNGFVSNKNDSNTDYSPAEADVDLYYTYNLKIEKQVEGALGDKTNQFPFQVVLTNTAIDTAARFSYIYNSEEADAVVENNTKALSSGTATIGSASATVADNFKLKDDEYIYIFGIPSYSYSGYTGVTPVLTTAVVTEFNNTYDIYKVRATFNSTQDATLDGTAKMASSATAATTSADSLITAGEDVMVVTNTIDAVSPTGYVVRYAPYALILIAGIALLVIARKHRKNADEE